MLLIFFHFRTIMQVEIFVIVAYIRFEYWVIPVIIVNRRHRVFANNYRAISVGLGRT